METIISKYRDDWFICTITKGGRIAVGYGVTQETALSDAESDLI